MADQQKIPPLDWQTPIVDPETGNPSSQFIRIWQQTFKNAEATSGDVTTKADKTTSINAGIGLDGGGDLSADRIIDLADTSVSPGTFTLVTLTVDQQGRITAISSGTPGVPEAPIDGQFYARKDGAWVAFIP